MSRSPAETLAALPEIERRRWVVEQGEETMRTLRRSWQFWSRPEQREPLTLWRWWLIKTGRGWGKNRTAAEWVLDRCEAFARADASHLVGLIGRSFSDVRALMIEGVSGLAACAQRRGYRLEHAPTALIAKLWIGDHCTDIELHTADVPDRVRGRNFHTVWMDEIAAWRHKVDEEGGTAFTNADLSLRAPAPVAGLTPRGVITSTPKPLILLRDLIDGSYGATHITHGSTYDNLANLDPSFVVATLKRYHGTRLGAQEIDGVLLDDVEGALWTALLIQQTRIPIPPLLSKPWVGVDPPGERYGAECGIVVAATNLKAVTVDDRHLYVIDDASMQGTPEQWAAQAVATARRHKAAGIVAETNNGHDMVRAVIHAVDPTMRVVKVSARESKRARAEPVSTLYERRRVHHVGTFGELEEQQTTWVPDQGDSPDRVDALVWVATHLLPEITLPPAQSRKPDPGMRLPKGPGSFKRTAA